MIAAVKACFAKYATFSSRSMRAEFWYFFLFLILVEIVLTVLNSALLGPSIYETTRTVQEADGSLRTETFTQVDYTSGWLGFAFSLATFVPALAMSWRRLHDVNRPGWWNLAPFVFLLIASALVFQSMLPFFTAASDGASADRLTTLAEGGFNAFSLIPFALALISIVVLLVWFASPGTDGPNRFGSDPREALP
ncbi:MAG: DUF805 domain-containing protein [Pseudomonadota bacterium]